MAADGAGTADWRNVDHIVATLELDVDPSDLRAVIRSLQDGMKRHQNTDAYQTWVSAFVFVRDSISPATSDPVERLPERLIGKLPAIRTSGALEPYSLVIEQQIDQVRIRAESSIRTRARRTNIGYASLSLLIGALWALPSEDNPLVRSISPYEWGTVAQDASGLSEGFRINEFRTSIWIVVAVVLGILWVAAFRRHHIERRIVGDVNDFRYQAEALSKLQATGHPSFTQAEFESQLRDRWPRDFLSRDAMLLKAPASTIIRILASVTLVIVMTAVIYAASQSYADAYYFDESTPSPLIFPGVILFELLLSAGIFALWVKPVDRESAIAALRFLPTEETVLPFVRGAAEPALERFVQRGTLRQVSDRNYMPTYAFAGAGSEAWTGDPPSKS